MFLTPVIIYMYNIYIIHQRTWLAAVIITVTHIKSLKKYIEKFDPNDTLSIRISQEIIGERKM